MFKQSVLFHKAAVQNIKMFNILKRLQRVFLTLSKKIGFIIDALFGNFVYLHNLYTVVELHTNYVLIHFKRQLLLDFRPRF